MLELSVSSVDVSVLLTAMEMVSEDALATVWSGGSALMVTIAGRNGPRTFSLAAGTQVTVVRQTPAHAQRPATIKIADLSRLLSFKTNGNALRISLDTLEGAMAVAVMRSPSGNTTLPDSMRICPVTIVPLPNA